MKLSVLNIVAALSYCAVFRHQRLATKVNKFAFAMRQYTNNIIRVRESEQFIRAHCETLGRLPPALLDVA